MYENGQGVVQDDKQAIKWARLAAEQGHAKAQTNLGWMYYKGKGVSQDDKEAFKWFQLAAEQDPGWTDEGGESRYQFSNLESDDDPILYEKVNKYLSTIYRNGNLEHGCYKIVVGGENWCVDIKVTKANGLIYMVTSGGHYDEQWEWILSGQQDYWYVVRYSILKESGDTFEIYADTGFDQVQEYPYEGRLVELNKKGDLAWLSCPSNSYMGGLGEYFTQLRGLVNGNIRSIASWSTGHSNDGQCGGDFCTLYGQKVHVSAIHKGDADFYPLYVVVTKYNISNGVKTEEKKPFLVEYSKDKKSYVLSVKASKLL